MNSSNIGAIGERQMCRRISEWLIGEKNTLICWRHRGSGSVATFRRKAGKATSSESVGAGDIVCEDRRFDFFFSRVHLDVKSLKTGMRPLLIDPRNRKSNALLREWRDVIKGTPEGKMSLMLIHSRRRDLCDLAFVDTDWPLGDNIEAYATIRLPQFADFHVVPLVDFFQQPVEDLRRDLEGYRGCL